MAARTMKLVANSLIKLANLVEAKVHVWMFVHIYLLYSHLYGEGHSAAGWGIGGSV